MIETLFLFICLICTIAFAISAVAILDGHKKAGGITAAIYAAMIVLSIHGIISVENHKTDEKVNRYRNALKDGYSVYYNGNHIEGDKLIVNHDTIYTFIISYDKDKKQILVMSKCRTRL